MGDDPYDAPLTQEDCDILNSARSDLVDVFMTDRGVIVDEHTGTRPDSLTPEALRRLRIRGVR